MGRLRMPEAELVEVAAAWRRGGWRAVQALRGCARESTYRLVRRCLEVGLLGPEEAPDRSRTLRALRGGL